MTAKILSLAPATLHDQVAQRLRQMLVESRIKPGAKLNERELSEVLKVSRTPLREAIKMLAAEGLVELLPNRGARVATLDDEHLVHLFEVIAALEAEGGRLACERITPAELAEVQGLHYRMYAHFLRGELPGYFALNQAIHAAIMRAAGNPVLTAVHAGLAGRITRARYMSNRIRPDRWQAAMDEHDAILDALARRDGPALGPLLARHLQNKRDIVTAALLGAGDADGTP